MNLAIIGSHSFAGNSYVAHVLERSACLTVSRSDAIHSCFDARSQVHHRFKEQKMVWNLNDDPDVVVSALQENNISTIVNFAAQSMVSQSWHSPQDWYQANVASFAKLLHRIQNETNVSRFIHFTTPEVYGSTEGWVKESFNFSPKTPYAVSRAAGDWHLKALHETFGFPVIFTRAANIYGEFQQIYRIVPKVILFALTGRKIPLEGKGRSIRSFIHISDVNTALDRIIDNGVVGDTYHIASKEVISIYNLVTVIAEKLNMPINQILEFAPERPGKDYAYQLDTTKLRSELGWEDKVSLTEGIARTISWVKSNLQTLGNLPTDYIHRI